MRSLAFNVLFWLWTLAIGTAGLPVLATNRRLAARFGALWARGSLAILAWTVGLRHVVRGREHLPQGAAIIAMKHQSAWDTIVLPLVFEDPAIVLKRELLWIPIFGWYAGRAGMIPIDRKAGAGAMKRIVRHARAAAAEGRPIVIFPEGTRTAVGARRPYQPGVAALYAQLGLPVVPVAVNSGLFWGRRSFRKRPGRIVVAILPPLPPGLAPRTMLSSLAERIETASAALVDTASDRTAGLTKT